MTNPAHPVYEFQVNLHGSSLFPSRHQQSQNRAYDEFNAMSDTRSIGIPGVGTFKHGEKFTVHGLLAQKLFTEFITGGLGTLVLCTDNPFVNCVPDTNVGTIDALVTATATAVMQADAVASLATSGTNYVTNDTITLAGGTFSEAAILSVLSVSTILGQDETNYSVTELNGSFTGGIGYSIGNVNTMSDGTQATVNSVSSGVVTEFTITRASTSGIGATNTTLTQSSSTGEGATGFSMTVDINNQSIFAAGINLVAELPQNGSYTDIPTNPVSQDSTSGTGSGATFNMTWSVESVTLTSGGSGYDGDPAVSFTGGTGTTATSAIAAGQVTGVTVVFNGSGYTSNAVVTIADPA